MERLLRGGSVVIFRVWGPLALLERELHPPYPVSNFTRRSLGRLDDLDQFDSEDPVVQGGVFLLHCWIVDYDVSAEDAAAVLDVDEKDLVAVREELWERRAEWAQTEGVR